MMAAVALICMTMTSVTLLSCGDDDDDKGKGNDGSKFTTAVLDFTFITSDETLTALDVIAEYYDANGKLQSEKLTQSTFKKTVKANLPAYLGARMLFKVKSGIDAATLGKVNITYGYEYSVWCENAKGEMTGYNGKDNMRHATLSGDKLGDKLENWASENSGLIKLAFDYTADAKIVDSGWK